MVKMEIEYYYSFLVKHSAEPSSRLRPYQEPGKCLPKAPRGVGIRREGILKLPAGR